MSHDDHKRMKIFAATGGEHLAVAMCDHLELPLGAATVDKFPDGEIIVKINEDIRGRDCFVVQSTSMPANDNLMELLIWIDTLRRASAGRITAVIRTLDMHGKIAKMRAECQLPQNSLQTSSLPLGRTVYFAWICMQRKFKASLIFRWIT